MRKLVFDNYQRCPVPLKATLGIGIEEEKVLNRKNNSGELRAGIDIPLKTVQIVGLRETSTRQGQNQECMSVRKQKVWFHKRID